MSDVKNCYTCSNAVIEFPFGEYKCMKKDFKCSVLVHPDDINDCPEYKKGKVKETTTDE